MADFANARVWDPSVSEARRVGEAPIGIGSAFDLVARFGGRDVPLRYEIVEYDSPRRVVLEARRPGFVSRDTITVEPAGERVGRALRRDARVRWARSAARPGDAAHLQSGRGSRDARDADGAEPVTPSPAANLVDWTLEASVVGSFTRIGYHARRRLFDWTPLQSLRLDGKVAIVTGATSGLGRAAAESIAALGGHVCIVGRDPERTERARSEISAAAGSAVEADLADLSSLAETAAFAARFAESHDRLDVLVLNAGALTHEYTVTGEGNEIDVRDPRPVAVPAHPCAAASARGVGTVARDRGRVRRHVHRAARRRRPRPGARRLRRDEGIRALQAGAGRAGRGVDAEPARHRRHRQRDASRLGRHPRAPDGASRLQPHRRAAAPDAGGGSRHDRLARRRPGRRGPQRPVLPRPASRGRSTGCAARAVPTRPARRRDSGGSARSARPRSRPDVDGSAA